MSLSDKIIPQDLIKAKGTIIPDDVVRVWDVKDFIKELKKIMLQELPFLTEDEEDYDKLCKEIDKLAGDKLNNG